MRFFTRWYSSGLKSKESLRQWVKELSPEKVPSNFFRAQFSRSSGPGGQKVKKTNSKVSLILTRTQWENNSFVPPEIMAHLLETPIACQRPKTGGLLITSDRFRSQPQNLQDCMEKFCLQVREVIRFENEPSEEEKRKWDRIADRERQKLKEKKKYKSEKKTSRKKLHYNFTL